MLGFVSEASEGGEECDGRCLIKEEAHRLFRGRRGGGYVVRQQLSGIGQGGLDAFSCDLVLGGDFIDAPSGGKSPKDCGHVDPGPLDHGFAEANFGIGDYPRTTSRSHFAHNGTPLPGFTLVLRAGGVRRTMAGTREMQRKLLQRVPFLAALSTEDLRWLARRVLRRSYKRGDIIFQKDDPGESMFIVEDGGVRIYVPGTQGADLTLAVMQPGEFFGDISLLDGRPRSASAEAAKNSALLTLDREDLRELVSSRPDAALAILAVIAGRLRETDQMATDLAFLDVSGRLARRLLDLAASSGRQREDGVLITSAITQEELANMIGVTRESVNRNLGTFRRLGLIAREGRRIVVRDEAGLRAYCE